VTHDSFFRTATRTVNAGAALTYQHDADGLLSGTSGLAALTVTRDFNGQNGLLTSTTVGGVSEAITYNTFGEPKTFASTFGATGVYAASFTSLDPLGRIASMSETLTGATHAWGFAYDEHGNLSSATRDGAATAYTYDPNGNRLTAAGQASTYDAQDRILTSPGVTYAYTNNGDLLSRTTASGTTSYAYDLLGALRSVSLPTGDTVAYAIDGAGRRVGRAWTHGASTLKQGFLYDDQYRVAAELDGQNNVVSTFVYATHANVPDVMVRAGVTYRIVSDWRGSVRAVVDVSAGTVVQKADYDPWGVATVTDTTCATGQLCVPFQPFGFSGGLADRETGLVRFGARDYDPSIGRWTQKDASGLGGGLNVYAYVGNDPINAFDMTGYNAVNDFANWAVPVASSVINFAWGVDNAILGGVPNFVAHALGLDDQYSRCSTAYKVGSGVGQAAMLVDGVGAAGVGGGAAEGADFAAHAAMRADLGLPAMGAEGSGALARLEAGGQEFWGINAHGQSVSPLSVNAISATHAEADAFAQAARAGVNGGTGRLIVDRALCPACGTFGAVRSMARQLGLESLEVVTPAGTSTLIP
jgi:RHS repeat-associated protein